MSTKAERRAKKQLKRRRQENWKLYRRGKLGLFAWCLMGLYPAGQPSLTEGERRKANALADYVTGASLFKACDGGALITKHVTISEDNAP